MKKLIIIFIIFIVIILGAVGFKNYTDQKVFSATIKPYLKIHDGTVILNYHSVATDEDSRKINSDLQVYNVPISKFQEHMNFLLSNDINIISMDQLYDNLHQKSFHGKNVVITFDDIDETVYTNAYPILKKNNIPFTLFLVTSNPGLTQDERTFASWDEIREMYNSNLAEIALHTDNMHKAVKGTPVFNDPANLSAFEKDLKLSISKVQKELNYTPKYFAYPYGYGTPQTDNVLMKNNIKMIFSLRAGVVTKDTKSFFIPRVLINDKNEQYVEYWLKH